MSLKPRFTIARLMVVLAAVAIVLAFFANAIKKGRIVETLKDPIAVDGWTLSGLQLRDGRIVPLPGVTLLPVSSPGLSEATKRGVEIAPDGRVYGLVRLHHWCGNDPIREHIVRIDLAHLLSFLREGNAVPAAFPWGPITIPPGGRFSQNGWDLSDHREFQIWREWAERESSKTSA